MNGRRIFSTDILLLLLALLPVFAGVVEYVPRDLWWDEIISLKDYALVDFRTTATLYPDPNNHIAFNLINNAASRILGKRSLFDALDSARWLRLLQAAFAFVTAYYLYRIARQFIHRRAAVYATVILATTIPFMNYFMQLRGYNLSMMFVVLLLYHTWSFEEHRKKSSIAGIILPVFLLLYTIPSNAYFVLSLMILYGWKWMRRIAARRRASAGREAQAGKPSGNRPADKRVEPLLILFFVVGALLSLLAYLPVLDAVLHNRFVENTPPTREFVLTHRLPQVLHHFLSMRYLLLLPFGLGIARLAKTHAHDSDGDGLGSRIRQLGALLLMPFLIAFLRGDMPFQRTFVHLIPIFVLLLAAGVWVGSDGSPQKKNAPTAAAVAVLAYCLLTFIGARFWVQRHLENDLRTSRKSQNIFYNYYQSGKFNPGEDLGILAEHHESRPGPILFADEIDRVSAHYYLNRYGLEHHATVNIQSRNQAGRRVVQGVFQRSRGPVDKPAYFRVFFSHGITPENQTFTPLFLYLENSAHPPDGTRNYYVVTAYPDKFRRIMEAYHKDFRCRMLNREISYHNLFQLTR